tara:strand:+ start:190 stop:1038 length:849 start_codon:yes stop_codon:yes gene_type:complete
VQCWHLLYRQHLLEECQELIDPTTEAPPQEQELLQQEKDKAPSTDPLENAPPGFEEADLDDFTIEVHVTSGDPANPVLRCVCYVSARTLVNHEEKEEEENQPGLEGMIFKSLSLDMKGIFEEAKQTGNRIHSRLYVVRHADLSKLLISRYVPEFELQSYGQETMDRLKRSMQGCKSACAGVEALDGKMGWYAEFSFEWIALRCCRYAEAESGMNVMDLVRLKVALVGTNDVEMDCEPLIDDANSYLTYMQTNYDDGEVWYPNGAKVAHYIRGLMPWVAMNDG